MYFSVLTLRRQLFIVATVLSALSEYPPYHIERRPVTDLMYKDAVGRPT